VRERKRVTQRERERERESFSFSLLFIYFGVGLIRQKRQQMKCGFSVGVASAFYAGIGKKRVHGACEVRLSYYFFFIFNFRY